MMQPAQNNNCVLIQQLLAPLSFITNAWHLHHLSGTLRNLRIFCSQSLGFVKPKFKHVKLRSNNKARLNIFAPIFWSAIFENIAFNILPDPY